MERLLKKLLTVLTSVGSIWFAFIQCQVMHKSIKGYQELSFFRGDSYAYMDYNFNRNTENIAGQRLIDVLYLLDVDYNIIYDSTHNFDSLNSDNFALSLLFRKYKIEGDESPPKSPSQIYITDI